ncbi:hypothetical protein [Desulfomonile tiedjei]|uniref:hypothetical protein n=1 Tax=Desulfomonile tiedjei TaxID=2358 RepID=UPI00145DF685|nr:hypothetical protein [Desulfomonile tiedjei]
MRLLTPEDNRITISGAEDLQHIANIPALYPHSGRKIIQNLFREHHDEIRIS